MSAPPCSDQVSGSALAWCFQHPRGRFLSYTRAAHTPGTTPGSQPGSLLVCARSHVLPLCETTVVSATAEMPTAYTSGPAAGGVVVQPSPSGQTRSHGAPVVPGAWDAKAVER